MAIKERWLLRVLSSTSATIYNIMGRIKWLKNECERLKCFFCRSEINKEDLNGILLRKEFMSVWSGGDYDGGCAWGQYRDTGVATILMTLFESKMIIMQCARCKGFNQIKVNRILRTWCLQSKKLFSNEENIWVSISLKHDHVQNWKKLDNFSHLLLKDLFLG